MAARAIRGGDRDEAWLLVTSVAVQAARDVVVSRKRAKAAEQGISTDARLPGKIKAALILAAYAGLHSFDANCGPRQARLRKISGGVLIAGTVASVYSGYELCQALQPAAYARQQGNEVPVASPPHCRMVNRRR